MINSSLINLNLINLILLVLCLGSICFYCYGIYAGLSFFRHPYAFDPNYNPPVTILKPICGSDGNLYDNLATFCQQDYPNFQIVFSVRDSEDTAIPIINQIIHDFPKLDVELVICDRIIGTNLKVSNLANAAVSAKHPILVLADSDIRVGRDYLKQVIQPFQNENVGVVTCLYRSLAQNWVTIIEALRQTTEFSAGVLVSNQLEGSIKFGFGQTIVIRKQALIDIGGFEAIADYLADDFQLGYLPAQAGYEVVLSQYIVEHELSAISIIDAIKQQIRWASCIRVSRTWGYLGLIFTYGIATSFALLVFNVSQYGYRSNASYVSFGVLFITWLTRLIMAWVVGVISLKDSLVKKCLWLIPFCDLFSFFIWCYCFLDNRIEWRGRRLKLAKDGKMIAIC
ncbi:bacteriohopanetetrol glucosamine biosynthesis glycosyltransferase HpnI [Brunnivagina elsteri]|nr:bacteriohopanetetrol glucosamine biosynthesis glycosyltransferase HpnI [Calothrix elsteri]